MRPSARPALLVLAATGLLLGPLPVSAAPLADPPATAPPTLGPEGGLEVPTCAPCEFVVARDAPTRTIEFVVDGPPGGWRTVRALRVTAPGTAAPQVLPVDGMPPVGPGQPFFIGAADVNFDGYADLYLATRRGVANAYATYWLFVPSTGALSPLGEYPIFTRDPGTATLSTFERGGEAGMVYRKQKYRFIDGTLTCVASEVQEETRRAGVYRRRTSLLKDGKLRVVRSELVKAPAPKP